MHLSSLYNSNESGRIILSSTLDLKLKSMTAHRLCAREDTFYYYYYHHHHRRRRRRRRTIVQF